MNRNTERITPTFKGFVATSKDALIIIQNALEDKLPLVKRRPKDKERISLINSGNIFVFVEESSGIKRWTDGISWSPSRIMGRFLIYRELDKDALLTKQDPLGIDQPFEIQRQPQQELQQQQQQQQYLQQKTYSSSPNLTTLNPSDFISSSAIPKRRKVSYNEDKLSNPNKSENDVLSTERATLGSLVGSYVYKESGLIKKSLSLTLTSNDAGIPGTKTTIHLISYYSQSDVINSLLPEPSKITFLKDTKISFELLNALRKSSIGSTLSASRRSSDDYDHFQGFMESDGLDEETDLEFQRALKNRQQKLYAYRDSPTGMIFPPQIATQPPDQKKEAYYNLSHQQQQQHIYHSGMDLIPTAPIPQLNFNNFQFSGTVSPNHQQFPPPPPPPQQQQQQQQFTVPQVYQNYPNLSQSASYGSFNHSTRRHSTSGSGATGASIPQHSIQQQQHQYQGTINHPRQESTTSTHSSTVHSPLHKNFQPPLASTSSTTNAAKTSVDIDHSSISGISTRTSKTSVSSIPSISSNSSSHLSNMNYTYPTNQTPQQQQQHPTHGHPQTQHPLLFQQQYYNSQQMPPQGQQNQMYLSSYGSMPPHYPTSSSSTLDSPSIQNPQHQQASNHHNLAHHPTQQQQQQQLHPQYSQSHPLMGPNPSAANMLFYPQVSDLNSNLITNPGSQFGSSLNVAGIPVTDNASSSSNTSNSTTACAADMTGASGGSAV